MLALSGLYAPTILTGRMNHDRGGQELGARDYYRLIVMEEGRLQISCGGEVFNAGPGDVYLIPPEADYGYEGHASCRSMMVAFIVRACQLQRVYPNLRAVHPDPPVPPQPSPQEVWAATWPFLLPRAVADAIRDSVIFAASTWWRSDQHHFGANQRLSYLLARMAQFFRSDSVVRPVSRAGRHPVGRVIDVIHEHYPTLRTAADIAAHIGISVSRMNESFRHAAGETPIACLRRFRLAEVERLLLCAEYSIKDIAAMTGFRDRKALHKAWMSTHEQPPLRWRRDQLE